MDRRTALLTLGGIAAASTLTRDLKGADQPWPSNIVTDDVRASVERIYLPGNPLASKVHYPRIEGKGMYCVVGESGNSIMQHTYARNVEGEFFLPPNGDFSVSCRLMALFEAHNMCERGEHEPINVTTPNDIMKVLCRALGRTPYYLLVGPSLADTVLSAVGGMRVIVSAAVPDCHVFATIEPQSVGSIVTKVTGEVAMMVRSGTVAQALVVDSYAA